MSAYVTDVCRNCGNLRSVCSDPNRPWYPQRDYCYATAVRDLTQRRVEKRYGPPVGTAEIHETDGMYLSVSEYDLTPDDDFDALGASPTARSQSDDQQHDADHA